MATVGLGIPWQFAEKDAGYYSRVLVASGARRWLNWKYDCLGQPGYLPMVWEARSAAPNVAGPFERALARAKAAPRQMWAIGNEPERQEQSNTPAAVFVVAANAWTNACGRQFCALPGILWDDQGRDWLERYLATPGRPIPGAWTIHIYGSDTPASWDAQFDHANRWFVEHGVWRSVWVTETSAHGDAAAQGRLLRHLHDRARRGLIVYWYAARDPFGPNRTSDLHDATGKLTNLGRVYAGLQGG